MILSDLNNGTLFNEVYGDETTVLWRVIERDEDLKISKCAVVGSRSRTEYKPFSLSVFIFPTQLKLF